MPGPIQHGGGGGSFGGPRGGGPRGGAPGGPGGFGGPRGGGGWFHRPPMGPPPPPRPYRGGGCLGCLLPTLCVIVLIGYLVMRIL